MEVCHVLCHAITSDETCLYCMHLWVEGEWMTSGSEKGSVLLRGNHLCKPPTLGTVLSDCQATLLDCTCFLIQLIISGKWNYLCIYSFVVYLYVVALCILAPDSPFHWTFRSHMCFSHVPVHVMTEWSRKCYLRCISDSCIWNWLFIPVVNRHTDRVGCIKDTCVTEAWFHGKHYARVDHAHNGFRVEIQVMGQFN